MEPGRPLKESGAGFWRVLRWLIWAEFAEWQQSFPAHEELFHSAMESGLSWSTKCRLCFSGSVEASHAWKSRGGVGERHQFGFA
jgi:hypothetical protein